MLKSATDDETEKPILDYPRSKQADALVAFNERARARRETVTRTTSSISHVKRYDRKWRSMRIDRSSLDIIADIGELIRPGIIPRASSRAAT